MKKQIVFFDGDGTLWYPSKTKYAKHPGWLYKDKRVKNHVRYMALTPSVFSTVKRLRQRGIITVILSAHPQPPEEACNVLNYKVRYFGLENLFDEIHATPPTQDAKGGFMLEILKQRQIPKTRALMVGDSYRWDYRPARENGIDALLIRSEYEPMVTRIRRTITRLSDVLSYVR